VDLEMQCLDCLSSGTSWKWMCCNSSGFIKRKNGCSKVKLT